MRATAPDPTGEALACCNCGVVAPMVRLPVSSLAPGELASSGLWLSTAAVLDAAATSLIDQTKGRGRFNQAQAKATAGTLREAAAEIRANLALEEMTACQVQLG
ncbi:hypothetical protein LJR090_002533 [Bosea sp. LjRoot90]|uniref:hypothetical protein n=1 Tax=Bosea sp. LjRoot90 TaxID=3342342 RepID=UPI003ECD68D0